MLYYQQKTSSVLPFFYLCFQQSLRIYSMYRACIQFISCLLGYQLLAQILQVRNPRPISVCILMPGGNKIPNLLQQMVPGSFILFNRSLSFRSPSNVCRALCQLVMMTGRMVQPYLSAYLMNPLRSFMYTRSSFGVVSVASSQPPGTIDIVYPLFISLFKFVGSTDWIPQSLKWIPMMGRESINLLPKLMAVVSFQFGYSLLLALPSRPIIKVNVPYKNTLWGWQVNIVFSLWGIYSSQCRLMEKNSWGLRKFRTKLIQA